MTGRRERDVILISIALSYLFPLLLVLDSVSRLSRKLKALFFVCRLANWPQNVRLFASWTLLDIKFSCNLL